MTDAAGLLIRKAPSIGDEATARRLVEAAAEVAHHQRLLAGARKRRKALIAKLLHAGYSERQIAEIAGISNVAVHNSKQP